jgi:hypothetical protein
MKQKNRSMQKMTNAQLNEMIAAVEKKKQDGILVCLLELKQFRAEKQYSKVDRN